MVDSLGRTVPESDFAGGDAAAAGVDGTAADGAPFSNAQVVLFDNAGHTATATTDAQGYYRINIKGFSPPFTAKVTGRDGTLWYAQSTTPVQTRGFVTLNLNGLTDKVASYVADAMGLGGDASKVTPPMLAANPSLLQASKEKLNTGLTSPLTYVGLSPASFDAVRSPYQAVSTDPYNKLLARVIVTKDKVGGNSVVMGTLAGFKEPSIFSKVGGVAVDRSGNLFVADTFNNTIRKINAAGVVSTFAGSGSSGFADGAGPGASFNAPQGVAVDSSGNVFVADTLNNSIRKITPSGVVSTLAGGGTSGFTNGTGSVASFAGPRGVAVDGNGNVLVADTLNNAIRKIAPGGVVSTLAGSGTLGFANGAGTVASFAGPRGVAVDSIGNVFVADTGNNVIRKIDPVGIVSTFSTSQHCTFHCVNTLIYDSPNGVAVDSNGNVFVANTNMGSIYKTDSVGRIEGSISLVDYSFNVPQGVAVDSNGNVFVADTGSQSIRKVTPGGSVRVVAGGSLRSGFTDGTGTAATFNLPKGVAVDSSGNVFVTDTGNQSIRKITPAGAVTTLAGNGFSGSTDGTGTAASFSYPDGIAVGRDGSVFVVETGGNKNIRKITPAGLVSTFVSNVTLGGYIGGSWTTGTPNPISIAVDSSGNLFVGDAGNNTVRKIAPTGVVSAFAGGGSVEIVNGAVAAFFRPSGVAVDNNGNVYVTDGDVNSIRKVTPSGVISAFAGSNASGFANGTGRAASFHNPAGVTVDNTGNVFVVDRGNYAIRKITPAGVVSTLLEFGKQGVSDYAAVTQFNSPWGVAIAPGGTLVLTDTVNNAIRVVLP